MGENGNFAALGARLNERLPAEHRPLVTAAVAAPIVDRPTYGFADLGAPAVATLNAIARLADPDHRSLASRATIALLATDALDRIRSLSPPADILTRAETWSAALFDFLNEEAGADYRYPDDLFLKDYRFVTALTLPCGAQVVDLAERVGPKTLLKLALRRPARAWRAATGPWFRPHTENRYLAEFNEAGWTDCYRRIAALLTRYPDVRGMIATSWFYDPQLAAISPRLAYLRDYPVARGALSVAHGTTAFDIHSATATSPTRRALYEEGRYRPVCHSILWFRADMLAWAEGKR